MCFLECAPFAMRQRCVCLCVCDLWGAAEDGRLFNVMVQHYENAGASPPAEALGVSAKFFADGRTQTARYHVGLRLPCAHVEADDAADALAASSKAAAQALSAPKLVHAWIDAIGTARVGLGFGFARLNDSGARGGKIYVMNLAGKMMPALPMSTDPASTANIYDSIPALLPSSVPEQGEAGPSHRSWLDSQMVSLEWQIGSGMYTKRVRACVRVEDISMFGDPDLTLIGNITQANHAPPIRPGHSPALRRPAWRETRRAHRSLRQPRSHAPPPLGRASSRQDRNHRLFGAP